MNKFNNHSSGFTLIELVTVIIIMGIVMVVAMPRVLTNDEVSAYTTQSLLVSALRSAQLTAMNNTDRCYRLEFSPQQYQLKHFSSRNQQRCTGTVLRTDAAKALANSVRFQQSNAESFSLDFNAQGQAFYQANSLCPQNCLLIVGQPNRTIRIESQGYIHGQ